MTANRPAEDAKIKAEIGIIGGSGLYEMEGFTGVEEVAVPTPFGAPSDAIMVGTLEGRRVAFLPRHGRGHRILPGELNFQANIYAMKALGVERILSVSAVGSLKEKYAPLHMVIPDQFVDRTKRSVVVLRPRPRGPRRASRTRSARGSARCWRLPAPRPGPRTIAGAPTSASRGRSSRPARSPSSTGRGGWTSSA